MNSTVGRMMQSKGDAAPDVYVPSKRMNNPAVSNFDNSLIGGQAPGDDPWQTTAQMSNSGLPSEQRKAHGKKILKGFEPELFVSPITGEPIADYGNWVEDMANQKKPGPAQSTAAEDLRALEKTDPVMFKLKSQLSLRGAKGAIGLSRVFRIMDDDGSNMLCYPEFKKAMQEFGMALNDTELVVLFKRFGELFISLF